MVFTNTIMMHTKYAGFHYLMFHYKCVSNISQLHNLKPMSLFSLYTTGHIGICVPDVDAACKRFEELNVEFIKKPNQGVYKT